MCGHATHYKLRLRRLAQGCAQEFSVLLPALSGYSCLRRYDFLEVHVTGFDKSASRPRRQNTQELTRNELLN